MSKYVHDTAAAKSLSAYVVLKKGVEIARVTAHYANSGRVLVNVRQWDDAVLARCEATAKLNGVAIPEDGFSFQHDTARGGGYDKFTAALAGMIIDGHTMADHSGIAPEDDKKRHALYAAYRKAAAKDNINTQYGAVRTGAGVGGGYVTHGPRYEKRAAALGCTFANWGGGRWGSLHFRDGLNRLKDLGYTVIQAI